MAIIAVDDERYALEGLTGLLSKVVPNEYVYGFRDPLEALAFAAENVCHVAFLDIEMQGMNGVQLARS